MGANTVYALETPLLNTTLQFHQYLFFISSRMHAVAYAVRIK